MKQYLNTIIISLAILLTAMILSNAFINRNKTSKMISVTGLGRKDFVSDLIVWSGSFTQKNISLKEAYASLDKDRESIRRYLQTKGIKSDNIIFSSVEINKLFDEVYDGNGRKIKSV
ncbi:MAG: SIMPL domain-containing protein, partial [Chitinophagaceae bacterium]|nr:SIMPL domain-containing protein [Chitinophagaceae bacterium]